MRGGKIGGSGAAASSPHDDGQLLWLNSGSCVSDKWPGPPMRPQWQGVYTACKERCHSRCWCGSGWQWFWRLRMTQLQRMRGRAVCFASLVSCLCQGRCGRCRPRCDFSLLEATFACWASGPARQRCRHLQLTCLCLPAFASQVCPYLRLWSRQQR